MELFSDIPIASSRAQESLHAWRTAFPTQPGNWERGAAANCNCSAGNDGGVCDIGLERNDYSLWLELAEDCNLDCVFCYNPWRPGSWKSKPLDAEKYFRVVNSIISKLKFRHVTLSGGEPLMYPLLPELLALIRSRGCESIGMTTNGRSMTRGRLKALTTAGLTHMSVPVHSHQPAVHDRLANGRSWTSAVRALALGVEYGITTTMSCVVTSVNTHHIGQVVAIAQQLGLHAIILNCIHATGQGSGRSDLCVPQQDFENLVMQAQRAFTEDGKVLVGSPPPDQRGRKSRIDRIVLSPFGDVKLCNQSREGVFNVSKSPDTLTSFLAAMKAGSHADFLERVDNCSCHGTV
ncbi:radical SAM protein [Streptomyces tubercidicus]|uniref:radical SAM protein n=1 Tax=Streptomyces tubercidicus TaxID=47759 RepID=UPI00346518E4